MSKKRDATIEELDLIAKAMELTEKLQEMNKDVRDTYLIYGPMEQPLEVDLTMCEYLEFYENPIFYYEFDGAPTQINTQYVSMIILKNTDKSSHGLKLTT